MRQDLNTHSFPGVDRLLDSTLPFTEGGQLVERLLLCWCESIQCKDCALVWWKGESQTAECVYTNCNRDLRRTCFVADAHVDALPSLILDALPQSASWDWVTIAYDDVSALGVIGFPANEATHIPECWISATARLLETARVWESSLTQKKLSALVEYAAGAGHEINNPLAAIHGRTSQLLRDEPDPHRRQLLETIGAQTYRIRDMIGDSMLFAAPPKLQFTQLDLNQLIETVVQQFAEEFRQRKISLWGNREPHLEIQGDETQLCVVLSELLRNCLNAVGDRGRIEIDCRKMQSFTQQDSVWLRVADNGSGLTPTEREHCFDPFFSGRQAGRGLGFGLSKCWRIITSHLGKIELCESPEGMTEFIICLPQYPLKN